MISPPTMAPGTEVKPPRISTGRALSAVSVSANCTPLREPHSMPATRATKPATPHTTAQICCSGMPQRQSRLAVVRHRAQRTADLVTWKNSASAPTSTLAMAAAARSNLETTILKRVRMASMACRRRCPG